MLLQQRTAGVAVLAVAALAACGSNGTAAREGDDRTTRMPAREPPPTCDFEAFAAGSAPDGFVTALTDGGAPGQWEVRAEPGAPSGTKVLAQVSEDDTDGRFPLCVWQGFTAEDVEVSVRFKAVSGEVDQAAGLVARYRDQDNYYVTRANALEGNVRLYRVVGGKRKQFAGVSKDVSAGEWHTLALGVKGQHFQVFYDGELLFEADDATIAGPGRVGLWTKADSVTCFDDLRIQTR